MNGILLLALAVVSSAAATPYEKACREELGAFPDLRAEVVASEPIEITLDGKVLREPGHKHCDQPSLANPDLPCPVGSRLLRYRASFPNVVWVGIERPGTPLGVIGWNERTGAACFFAPGAKAADNCLRCHTNPDPFVVTPHLRAPFAKLGVKRRLRDFVDGEYRLHYPGLAESYLRPHTVELTQPDNPACTRCHALTAGTPERRHIVLAALDNPQAWMPFGPHREARERKAAEALKRFFNDLGGEPAIVARVVDFSTSEEPANETVTNR